MGGDFFKNPEGLNLLFWIPATYLCSLFFIFCFVTDCRLSKMVVGKGIKFWGQKKMKTNFIPMLFLNRNLILFLLLVLCVLKIPLEPITPNLTNMFFGNGKALTKAMQILPSAMWQWRRQVYCFLFAYRDVSDCFCDGLAPQISLTVTAFHFINIILESLYGSQPSRSNNRYVTGKWKTILLLGLLVLWVLKMAFTIGKLTEIKSHFYNLQKQWKHYRFKWLADKTVTVKVL